MCPAVEETNIEATLAVMNTTELVVEMRPEKIGSCVLYWPRSTYRPIHRPIYRSTIDRLSVDSRPTIGR